MAALSLQHTEPASNASEPIIEDITELCEFCVKLTKKISKTSVGESPTIERSEWFEPDITPGMCRFCEIISNNQYTRDVSIRTEFILDRDMGRRRSSKEPPYSRICATSIDEHTFAMWADPGKMLSI